MATFESENYRLNEDLISAIDRIEHLAIYSESDDTCDQHKRFPKNPSLSYFEDVSTSEDLLRELNRLRMTGSFCDAILATNDGATFRVHKVAMSWCSNYFRTLFTTSLVDKSSGEGPCSKTHFHVPNITSSVLETIIKYAYSGIVDVNKENVNELLPAADQFNVPGVVDVCVQFMLDNITTENCVGIWRFGKEYYMPRLEKEARRYLLAHFVEISVNSEEFLHLRLKYLKDILKDNALNTPTEFLVWLAIKRWCQYKYSNRQKFIPCLLQSVRLALLPISDFRQIMDDPRVFKHIQCRSLIEMVSKFILNERQDVSKIVQTKKALFMFTPRHPHEMIFVSGGWTQSGLTNISEVYDCRANLWKMIFLEDFSPRAYHQTVSLGEYIYVLGGSTEEECLNSCWRFNISSLKFEEISPMQEQRCYLSAAILVDKIYAIGGFDGYDRKQTAEYYDHVQNQWTYISPMNERRSDASASSLRDRIFVVGGFDGEDFLQSAECYYSEFDQWFLLPLMLKCRSGLGCVAMADCVYAIGGYDGEHRLNSVEKYCIKNRQWFPIKAMKNARSNFGTTLVEKKIYVMGGYDDATDNTTDLTECFDTSNPQWLSIAPLNVSRSGFSTCTFSVIGDITPYIKDDRFRCLLKNTSQEETIDLNNTE